MQETQVHSLGQEDPLEKEMATQSSILAWEIPRTEKPSRLQPWGCKEQDTIEQLDSNNNHCSNNSSVRQGSNNRGPLRRKGGGLQRPQAALSSEGTAVSLCEQNTHTLMSVDRGSYPAHFCHTQVVGLFCLSTK